MYDDENDNCRVKPELEIAVTETIWYMEELIHSLRLIEEYLTKLPDEFSKKSRRTLLKMSDELYEHDWLYDGARQIDAILSKVLRTIPEHEVKEWKDKKISTLAGLLARLKALPDDSELKMLGQSIYYEDSLRNLDKFIEKYEGSANGK